MENPLAERLLTVLRASTDSPSLEYASPPERLPGGFWAELLAVRLASAPDGWPNELVVRVMPDAVLARKETVIQAEVAAAGFPTPAVRLSGGTEAGLGRAFMVMDRAEGAPVLADLAGGRALLDAPRIAARIPATLADAMAQLHRLDPDPVRRRLEAGGDAASVPGLLATLAAGAEKCGRRDLVGACAWLVANVPPGRPDVICHGDLHPFNLLVDGAGRVTVLDWSAALIGPPAYDVAFTSLVLAEPPLAVPAPARPLVRAAGRWLSRRFVAQYCRRSGTAVDVSSMRWHQGVACLRVLVAVALWDCAGEIQARRGHPWLVCEPAFAARLSELTGVSVESRVA
jgi:aminoglycoside phosphotransferase (APT) family kinase protein